ncbi:MAG: hypothetical protein Q9216_002721 [Gyalolechia sp. 2 TL-2023]
MQAIAQNGNEDRGPELLAVTWTFTVLAFFVVIARFYTKALAVTCTSLFTEDVRLGMGQHAQDLDPAKLVPIVRLNFIANPFGIMAYSLPNISVAIVLNRIIAPRRTVRITIYAVSIAQSIIAAISCVLLFAQCTPSEYLWNPTVEATCMPPSVITGYSYFVGAYSAFTDIFLAVIPAVVFWKLQLKTKTKVGLCLLMGTTALAAICAIVKTTKLYQLADLADFTYGTVDLIIWAIVEANVIIIAACIPTLKPFVFAVQKGVQGSERRSLFERLRRLRSYGYSKNAGDGSGYGDKYRKNEPSTDEVSAGDYPLVSAVKPKGVVDDDGPRPTSTPPPSFPRIKRTTEIATEWETV